MYSYYIYIIKPSYRIVILSHERNDPNYTFVALKQSSDCRVGLSQANEMATCLVIGNKLAREGVKLVNEPDEFGAKFTG